MTDKQRQANMESVIDIARECGAQPMPRYNAVHFSESQLAAFAEWIRADERERCAKLCDEMVLYTGLDCAAAIREPDQAGGEG